MTSILAAPTRSPKIALQAMHAQTHALVLCGGEINHANLPIGTNRSNAMVPVNGKPVVGWLLDHLISQGFTDVTLVLRSENTHLRDFVQWAYRDRLAVQFAFVVGGGSILQSLQAGLHTLPATERLHLILGDTLIRDQDLLRDEDYLLTGPYEGPEHWCLVATEGGTITQYYDKKKEVPEGLSALVGYYHFVDVPLLKTVVQEAVLNGKRELSAALKGYGKQRPFRAIAAQDWLDFGHLNSFQAAKRQLLQARFFNSLSIDSTRGILTKQSEKNDKLLDELNWYRELPPRLQVLAPRLLEESETEPGQVTIVQEYYGYPNLAELYVFGDLDLEIWHNSLQALLRVASQFQGVEGPVNPDDLRAMYWTKTRERLTQLRTMDDGHWEAVLSLPMLEINGTAYTNFEGLAERVKARVEDLAASLRGSVIHGDYCFSNILYDVTSQIVRVIDPRGSFGQKGIYGDPRYDLAKLRHSIVGRYDFLIAGLFTVETLSEGRYQYEIFSNTRSHDLATYFDEQLAAFGAEPSDIRFIEALLFVSMVPYHAGNPARQLTMYLQGIKLLNESLPLEA